MALTSPITNAIATKFKATTTLMTMKMFDVLLRASKKIVHLHISAAARHSFYHRILVEEMVKVTDFYDVQQIKLHADEN